MVLADDLRTDKSYKFSTNGFKLGKYLRVNTHITEVDPQIQPPPPPQYNDTYVFQDGLEEKFVPSFNLRLVIEDPTPTTGGRGRYRTTRRKQLRRLRKSHKKIIKNNKK
jgi:hypothetical protein